MFCSMTGITTIKREEVNVPLMADHHSTWGKCRWGGEGKGGSTYRKKKKKMRIRKSSASVSIHLILFSISHQLSIDDRYRCIGRPAGPVSPAPRQPGEPGAPTGGRVGRVGRAGGRAGESGGTEGRRIGRPGGQLRFLCRFPSEGTVVLKCWIWFFPISSSLSLSLSLSFYHLIWNLLMYANEPEVCQMLR